MGWGCCVRAVQGGPFKGAVQGGPFSPAHADTHTHTHTHTHTDQHSPPVRIYTDTLSFSLSHTHTCIQAAVRAALEHQPVGVVGLRQAKQLGPHAYATLHLFPGMASDQGLGVVVQTPFLVRARYTPRHCPPRCCYASSIHCFRLKLI